jgi:hypothetical protein
VESCSGFKGLDQEPWKSLHPDGVHQESIWSLSGVYQDSMMVHNGCYLKRGPDRLLIQFQEFTWTPDGVHLDLWLSVRPSWNGKLHLN